MLPILSCIIVLSSAINTEGAYKVSEPSDIVLEDFIKELQSKWPAPFIYEGAGRSTDIDEFPWAVLLGYRHSHSGQKLVACSGALLNTRYVLTSAYCVHSEALINGNWSLDFVRFGEHDTSSERDCSMNTHTGTEKCANRIVEIKISGKFVHKLYGLDSDEISYNVALVRTSRDVRYTRFVKPICLPYTSYLYDSEQVFSIVKWHRIGESSSLSYVKSELTSISCLSYTACSQLLKKRVEGNIILDQFCLNTSTMHRGNDIPGIVVAQNKNTKQWHVVGIPVLTSLKGIESKIDASPYTYTRIYNYLGWIKKHLNNTDESNISRKNHQILKYANIVCSD